MRYLAVDRLIDHWDGIVGWYCPDGVTCFNHNDYWYEQADADRMWLLPWDMVNSLQAPNPIRDTYGMPDWNGSTSCALVTVFLSIPGRPPACDDLIRRLGTVLWDDYQAATTSLLGGAAAPGVIEAKLDRWAAQIAEATIEDPSGPGVEAWQRAFNELRADLPGSAPASHPERLYSGLVVGQSADASLVR